MNTSDSLFREVPARNNQYTPIAYTAASLALCTHMHPIQALQYVFSDQDLLCKSSDYGTSLEAVQDVVDTCALPTYCEVGDISEDPKLVGHMESLSESICRFMEETGLTLDTMNEIFENRQVWESMACAGRAWVSSGIDWTVEHLKESCSL